MRPDEGINLGARGLLNLNYSRFVYHCFRISYFEVQIIAHGSAAQFWLDLSRINHGILSSCSIANWNGVQQIGGSNKLTTIAANSRAWRS